MIEKTIAYFYCNLNNTYIYYCTSRRAIWGNIHLEGCQYWPDRRAREGQYIILRAEYFPIYCLTIASAIIYLLYDLYNYVKNVYIELIRSGQQPYRAIWENIALLLTNQITVFWQYWHSHNYSKDKLSIVKC